MTNHQSHVDHLGWFDSQKGPIGTIEDIMREKGESVTKLSMNNSNMSSSHMSSSSGSTTDTSTMDTMDTTMAMDESGLFQVVAKE